MILPPKNLHDLRPMVKGVESDYRWVKVWSLTTGNEIRTLTGHVDRDSLGLILLQLYDRLTDLELCSAAATLASSGVRRQTWSKNLSSSGPPT